MQPIKRVLTDDAPPISPQLINWLAQVFPNRLPSTLAGGIEQVARLVGQQDVLTKLRAELERQEQGALETILNNVLA